MFAPRSFATAALATFVLGASPLPALDEKQALDAVERFIAAWNSRDPAAFAATLHYPHVRPAAEGGKRIFKSVEEYTATVDFERVASTGWDHSRLDSARVIQLGQHRAHVAGQYSRHRQDGSTIWSNQVGYVVTERNGSIGIQARFAAGLVLESEPEREAIRTAALEAVEAFLDAFNDRDEEAWAATLNYPHVRLAGEEVRVFETPEEYTDAFDFTAFAERYGWHYTRWDSIEAVQVSAAAANVAVRATRYGADHQPLHSFDTFYLVTRQNGHWGIRARSSFAP